jgi:hypothetical protein
MGSKASTELASKIAAVEPLHWIARIGYAIRGVVFLIVGGLALLAAGGYATRPQGARDALQMLAAQPLGGVLLWAVAGGLSCVAGWRFLQSFFDADDYGAGPYGLMRRGAYACGGIFYVALAAATARIVIGDRTMSEEQSARDWTHWLMIKPYGRGLIALIAAVLIGVAISLAIKSWRAPYRRTLDASPTPRAWAVALGSFGILTRAYIFFTIGIFLGYAAYDYNSTEVVGVAGVLDSLQQQSYGRWILAVVALGLLAFGCFEIIEAFVRRVHAPKLAR